MNRRIITEVGDSNRKDLKDECNANEYNFISNKRYLHLKSNASESAVELKRQSRINPMAFQQENVSIDQTKLYSMAKLSLQGQTEQLKNCQWQDLNLQKKSSCLFKNLDKLEHKIFVNQDQFTKRRSQLLKQLMQIKQSDRSKSNYNLQIKDGEKIETILQVRSIMNAEGRLEQQQRRFQIQNQSVLRMRQRLASCLEQSQDRSLSRLNMNFSALTIQRKELINKNSSQLRIRMQQNCCNKEINTN
ncbi:unnamed protein product (macronuclear) [Paramecium tetraurelia]|uniref:Uncharacterized protein n=1 Tax=Paramecium tetraurelia TaxID=5888 RepID=A0D327_PARTE|nr:uncharacterized protein GSPATT00012929001 [Paramecium tetraurelia]CAK77444.1 unnamed protein product [Paramecium tetraurelia]|eukprot:XP_001444841.1 hypothetical protein (macronuclear) [Paramecium tetraurelia strain d4-2]